MLFSKIQGSDVVDVANLTLEQDVLTGTRHSYPAVLTADKKKDLRYLRWRNTQVVERQPHISRRESNHADCQIRQQGFGRSKISQGVRNVGITPRNAGKALGKLRVKFSAGRMLAPYCHKVNFYVYFNCNYSLSCECS